MNRIAADGEDPIALVFYKPIIYDLREQAGTGPDAIGRSLVARL